MRPCRLLLPLLLLTAACEGPEATGLQKTPLGNGPAVRWDLDHKPLPEVPLPNDVATVRDPSSPTGRRLNVSLQATTLAERELRAKVDGMDGFGLYSPIMVSFDAPLDAAALRALHADHDLSNDGVLVVNVTPGSPDYGQAVPLDVGNGNYPIGLEWPWQYWDHDPHADSPNLLFETHDEDLNANGVLDPYEDIDFDGVLDRPNTFSGKPVATIDPTNLEQVLAAGAARPIDDLITYYEKETHTLVLWPTLPMRQGETYAVVLTTRLVGEDGAPVRSPFPSVNPLDQTAALQPLEDLLPAAPYSTPLADVAFAWTFTTQTITDEMAAIRAGLYGEDSLAWLADQFVPDLAPKILRDAKADGTEEDLPYILTTKVVGKVFGQLGPLLGYPAEVVKGLEADTQYVDYWVMGTFTTPSFLVDKDGLATPMYPADDNESFQVDPVAGTAAVGPSKASFLCSVPVATDQFKPPFPAVLYGHGYSGAPFEIFGFAGRFAQMGYALCGLDAAGHGLALPADDPEVPWNDIVPALAKGLHLSRFLQAFLGGRIRDLDNDGQISSFDNGGDFWSWDVFHMRDMVRQTVVDHLQFIRILRQLGSRTWAVDTNAKGEGGTLMGDFNGDGVVDLGGPWDPASGSNRNRYYPAWGQSMGAFVAQVLAATEATTSTATPVSGGAGLIHVGLRSTNPGVPEAVHMPLMGPFIVFHPRCDDGDATCDLHDPKTAKTVEIAFMINDLHREYCLPPSYAGVTDPEVAHQIALNRANDYCPHDPKRPHYYRLADSTDILPGDTVVVRNKANGEEVRAFRDLAGHGFRVSLPCDAPSAVEKRPLLGLKDGDTAPVPVTCAPGTWTVALDDKGKPTGPATCPAPDPSRAALFGDPFEIAVYDGWWDGQAAPKAVIDSFGKDVTYQGALFPAGTPLTALATGLGRGRNTPEFRRLMAIAAMVVEKADPAVYARHYRHEDRLDFSYDQAAAPQANVLVYHSVGDPNVPIATSISLGRAMGAIDQAANDRLIGMHLPDVVEAYWRHPSDSFTVADWQAAAERFYANEADPYDRLLLDPRWPDEYYDYFKAGLGDQGAGIHPDPDDLDGGTNEFGEETPGGPVRATLKTEWGTLAVRFPYTVPIGAHGVEPSNPTRQFNINNFVENQIIRYMTTDGMELSDDPCLESNSCDWMPESLKKLEY
jgi:hypothetical protein